MPGTDDANDSQWWVACLCAGWCGVCRDWQPMFLEQALAHPGLRFAWVDVEDESDAMGEVDIETFPTLLVARGDEALFLGPIPPSGPQFTRLLATLQARPSPSPTLPVAAGPLLQRLKPSVLPRAAV
jgi:thiol-disulfide isomerase/thioredoxin